MLHGIEGVKILQKENIDPRIVQIVKTHIGTGLTVDEAKKFGLPLDDYFPKTIIEIIVSHADKLVNGAEIVSFNEACEKLVRKFGEDTLIVKNFHKQKQLIENTKRKKL